MDFFNQGEPEGIIHNIRHLIHCPFCEGQYGEDSIQIIAQFNKNYISHLTCPNCNNSIVASFSYIEPKGTMKDGGNDVKLDVKMNEMVRFAEKGRINDDDVMDFYKKMGQFDGNFTKIFKSRIKKVSKRNQNDRL